MTEQSRQGAADYEIWQSFRDDVIRAGGEHSRFPGVGGGGVAAVVNAYGNHPMLSAWAMILAVVMLVVLAMTAVMDER